MPKNLIPPLRSRGKKSPIRLISLWAPPLLYAGVIFYLSSRAIPAVVAPPEGLDKVVHGLVYAGLGALLARALLAAGVRGAVWWAALLGALYGVSDEVHQSFVPERSWELLDVVADAVGSLAGAWTYALTSRRLFRPSSFCLLPFAFCLLPFLSFL